MSAIDEIQNAAGSAAEILHDGVNALGMAAQEIDDAKGHWGGVIGLDAVGGGLGQAAAKMHEARAHLDVAWRQVGNVQRTVGQLRVKNELVAVLEALQHNNADFDAALGATWEADHVIEDAKRVVAAALQGSRNMEDLLGKMNFAQERVREAVEVLRLASGANLDTQGRITR